VHRWDALNERQLALLTLVSTGADLGVPQHVSLRQSARAVADRGLIAISRRGGAWHAKMTDAGRFYLQHGHHPDHPGYSEDNSAPTVTGPRRDRPRQFTPRRSTRSEAQPLATQSKVSRTALRTTAPLVQRRRAQALALVEQLGQHERPVVIDGPTEEDLANWRKVVDYAKRHNLLPDGHRIEKNTYSGDLVIRLVHGAHANSKPVVTDLPPVPVPRTLHALNPVITNLLEDKGRLVVPKELRRRCLLVLQGLAVEAVRRGHQVGTEPVAERYHHSYYGYGARDDGPRYTRRDAELRLVVDSFRYKVTIRQLRPQTEDPESKQWLVIELNSYQSEGRQYRWTDTKLRRVEDGLAALLNEVETRAVEDRQRRVDEERAKAERKVQWERAMEVARYEATQAYYAKVLDAQVKLWRSASVLRVYRDELERRLGNPRQTDGDFTDARQWLSWIDGHLDRVDPIENPPAMPNPPELGPEDLAPFLRGMSPHGPEQHLSSWRRP
jgi:hypothetical protein